VQEERQEGVQGVSTEVTKPQVFNGALGKVLEFVIACRLYRRMRMRGAAVEEQIQ